MNGLVEAGGSGGFRRASGGGEDGLVGYCGVAGFLLAWGLVTATGWRDAAWLVIVFMGLTAAPMITASLMVLRTHRRASAGLGRSPEPGIPWGRWGIKALGMAGVFGCLACAYGIIPEYGRQFYAPVWRALAHAGWPLAVACGAYFVWAEPRADEPRDGAWHAGLVLVGRFREVDGGVLWQFALGWLVKGFYLPLMMAGAAEQLARLAQSGVGLEDFGRLYTGLLNLLFAADVTFGAVGYVLTVRALDSHTRGVDGTITGWASAVVCYVPFSAWVWGRYLDYKGPVTWDEWLGGHPWMLVTWGMGILLLMAVYVWATVAFGCRFSNLTHRGVVACGPYRLMRHPAYVAKNLAWWLMYVPFAAHATPEASGRACACLLLTNLIYAIRARTEEAHLLRDPAYAAYWSWVEAHGMMAQLRQLPMAAARRWRRMRLGGGAVNPTIMHPLQKTACLLAEKPHAQKLP